MRIKHGFKEALELKDRLLSVTWNNYLKKGCQNHTIPFNQFCERESYWLDDYVMYVILKDLYKVCPGINGALNIRKDIRRHWMPSVMIMPAASVK
jgi:4-alpha-glucanotransferase